MENVIESPVILYKTDYNNQSDLSRFVSEYKKAQAMIKECNEFYKSFLKSKLLTYSQLTNTIWKKDSYKFYKCGLSHCDTNISVYEISKHFGFDVKEQYFYVHNNVNGVIWLSNMLAAFELSEIYKKDDTKLAYPEPRIYQDLNVDMCNLIFKKSGLTYTVYGERCGSYKKFEGINQQTDENNRKYAKSLYDAIEKDWNDIKRKWVGKVLDYIGYDNIVYANVELLILTTVFEILDAARKTEISSIYHANDYLTEGKKKEIKCINDKFDNEWHNIMKLVDKRHIKIKLDDFIDREHIIGIFTEMALANGIGHWSCFNNDDFIKIPDDMHAYIKSEIADILQICQETILKYAEYDTKNLYIIRDNEALLYCTSNDIDKNKVNIHLEGNKLVCVFKDETGSKYNQFSRTTKCKDTYKTITFDVDTNEMISYNVTEDTYEISYRY